MASTRVKKLGGVYSEESFKKIVKQLNGRAILVVVMVNSHCPDCQKLLKFIQQLENGFIDRLPQLFLVYGFSDRKVLSADEVEKSKSAEEKANTEEGEKEKGDAVLGDSRFLFWEKMVENHGYAIFVSEQDIQYYNEGFEHDEFVQNIIDTLRRFKSSIRTLQGLSGKRDFMNKKRSGIIIETNSATPQSQIMAVEEYVKEQNERLKIPVYFCKGIAQEMLLVKSGEVVFKQKGLKIDKFIRKIPKYL